MNWCTYDSTTGEIVMSGCAGPNQAESDFSKCGGDLVLGIPNGISHETHYYLGGEFHEFGAPPGEFFIWDWALHAWRLSDTAAADNAAKELAEKKRQRQQEVSAILVTTQVGNVFEGDEVSQGRMARAILGMQTQPGITINWVLANNIPMPVDAAELTEALALAGLAQASIWSRPYE